MNKLLIAAAAIFGAAFAFKLVDAQNNTTIKPGKIQGLGFDMATLSFWVKPEFIVFNGAKAALNISNLVVSLGTISPTSAFTGFSFTDSVDFSIAPGQSYTYVPKINIGYNTIVALFGNNAASQISYKAFGIPQTEITPIDLAPFKDKVTQILSTLKSYKQSA